MRRYTFRQRRGYSSYIAEESIPEDNTRKIFRLKRRNVFTRKKYQRLIKKSRH